MSIVNFKYQILCNLKNQGVNRLEDARRTALETEEIGMGVMSDLRDQRETIAAEQPGDRKGLLVKYL